MAYDDDNEIERNALAEMRANAYIDNQLNNYRPFIQDNTAIDPPIQAEAIDRALEDYQFGSIYTPQVHRLKFNPSRDWNKVKRFGGEVLSSFKSASRLDQPSYKKNPGRRTKG